MTNEDKRAYKAIIKEARGMVADAVAEGVRRALLELKLCELDGNDAPSKPISRFAARCERSEGKA